MNETANCMLEQGEYEKAITIGLIAGASIVLCCVGCAIKKRICK